MMRAGVEPLEGGGVGVLVILIGVHDDASTREPIESSGVAGYPWKPIGE